MRVSLRKAGTTRNGAAAVLLLILMVSCDDPVREPYVEPELEPIVGQLIAEGAARGYSVSAENLEARFVDRIVVDDRTLCGLVPAGSKRSRPVIEISTEPQCWALRHAADREALVFHELGHALLGRKHDDGLLPGGAYRSIMNSRTIVGLYTKSKGLETVIDHNKRSYYVDELFDPATPVPGWAMPF